MTVSLYVCEIILSIFIKNLLKLNFQQIFFIYSQPKQVIMKKTLLLSSLFISFLSFAQNPTLFEKRWFVESVSINGVDYEIPLDHFNFPFAYIDFYNTSSGLVGSSNEIMKGDCSSEFVGHLTYSGQNSFHFTDFTSTETNTGCETQDDDMLSFMQTYKSYFSDSINDDFSYAIQDVYGIDHLHLTKPNGDTLWFTEVYNLTVNNELASTWDLSKLNIDGNEIISPDYTSFTGTPYIVLDIKNYYSENIGTGTGEHVLDIQQTFNISGCNLSQSMLDLYQNDHEFYLYGHSGTLSDCGYSYLSDFNSQHTSFYFNNLPGVFTYTISQNNGVETLIVTNVLGNQAFYSRNILSVNDAHLTAIKIYPNPTTNYLNVVTELNINNIKIYSLLGQELLTSKSKTIDVSALEKGMYLLAMEDENKRIYKQQFYKID